MPKERIPNWFYENVPNMTIAVIKEIVSDAIIEERKQLAEKIRNFVDKEIHKASSTGDVLDRLSEFIESEDS